MTNFLEPRLSKTSFFFNILSKFCFYLFHAHFSTQLWSILICLKLIEYCWFCSARYWKLQHQHRSKQYNHQYREWTRSHCWMHLKITHSFQIEQLQIISLYFTIKFFSKFGLQCFFKTFCLKRLYWWEMKIYIL